VSQQTSKNRSFSQEKTLSFHNPFASRTANPTTNTNLVHDTENRTNLELTKDRRYSLLTNRRIKYLIPILVFIILTIITITLTVYYTKNKKEEFSTGQFSFTHNFSMWTNINNKSFCLSL
jgi:hypothetical protein